MSEPKKQELANLQAKGSLSLVSTAELEKLVDRPAEETLVVHGTVIHCTDSGLYSLNDLHKASGADDSKRPYAYLRTKAGQEFIDALKSEGVENVYETITGGESQGTYAHKLLAYEYATYLDKTFRLKAMLVLDRVTVAQVEQVQVAYKAVVEELGEERAKRLKTVEELGSAYQSLHNEEQRNSDLINMHRGDKRLNKNSPVVQELGLAKRNVQFMWAHLDSSQRDLISVFDFLESLGYMLEQEIKEKALNNYYTKLLRDKIINPCKAEAQDLKETLSINTKVLNDAKQYLSSASKFVSDEVRNQSES